MTPRPRTIPALSNGPFPTSAPGPSTSAQGTPPETNTPDPSSGPQALTSSAPARLASDAAQARPFSSPAITAPAGWERFAEQILDLLAEPTNSFWAFDEVPTAISTQDDSSKTGDPDARDEEVETSSKDIDEPAADTVDIPDAAANADDAEEEPEWDHPPDDPDPDDPLAFFDEEAVFGPLKLPVPPPRDPRAGLIPRLLPLLATLRLARTFRTAEQLRARLLAHGAIVVIETGEAALDKSVEAVLAALLPDKPRSAIRAPFISLLDEGLDRGSTRPRSFPGLGDLLEQALLRGRGVILITADASVLPDPIAALSPEVISLVPPDRPILGHLLQLLRPELEDHALDRLPGDDALAGLDIPTIALALRASDAQTFSDRLATALTAEPPKPEPGPGLRDFPLPQPVRDAVDQLLADLHEWQDGRLPWKDVTRGFLLYGPAGSGKTEVARLIAQEAEVTFFGTSLAKLQASGSRGSDTIRELRALFAKAAAAAPAVVFIDELDAVGDRDRPHDHNSSWTNAIVAGFLEVLDGFDSMEGVLSIAATNYPNKIDAALRRPGRFDQLLTLGHPAPDQLPAAIRWHLGRDLPDADLTGLARQCIGMSGAEVARLVRSARALARREREPLAIHHLEASLTATRPPLNPALRWRVAVHESGHTLAAHLSSLGTPHRVAIHADGGFTETPRLATSATLGEMEAMLTTLMAGRAAERLILGEASAGAGGLADSDLAKATELATALEVSFGLADGLIWRGAPDQVHEILTSDADLRRRVEERLVRSEAEAERMLEASRDRLDMLAHRVMTEGLVAGDTLSALLVDPCEGRDRSSGPRETRGE